MCRYLAGLVLLCFSLCGLAQQKKQPNIVIIFSDDHAVQSIGAYGSPYGATPNLDTLAKQGAVFNKAFVANSICAPSRATLLTGKYSHANGMRDNHDIFNSAQDIFPSRLAKVGYQTSWIGKWHLVSYPQGFDHWNILPGQGQYYNPSFISMQGDTTRKEGYATDVTTDLALEWINARDTTRPFFIVIGQKAPHRTWMPDLQDLGKFDDVKFPLPPNFYDNYKGRPAAAMQDMSIEKTMRLGYDLKMQSDPDALGTSFLMRMTDMQRRSWNAYYDPIDRDLQSRKLSGRALTEWKFQRYMKDYYSTTLSLDRNIGRVMKYLDEHGLTENTIVVYSSDQGFYMGEHGWFDKRFMYEESMRTPLIIRYPSVVRPGRISEQMVSNVDFAPTFLEAGGAQIPESIQGRSMMPILKDENAKIREEAYYHFYEYPGEHSVLKHFGIRTDRFKLIRFYDHQNFWELYDLENDPLEMNNLYKKKKYTTLIADLKQRLKELIEENGDPVAIKYLD